MNLIIKLYEFFLKEKISNCNKNNNKYYCFFLYINNKNENTKKTKKL